MKMFQTKKELHTWVLRFLIMIFAVILGLVISAIYNTSKSYACTYEEVVASDFSGYNYNDVVKILNEDLTESTELTDTQKESCLIGDMKDHYKDFDSAAKGIKYEALIAISAMETGYFSSDVCNLYNNVGGMQNADGYMLFNSKQESIYALANLLTNEYLDPCGNFYEGTTILDVSKHYNQNVHWVNMYVKVRLDMEKRQEEVEANEKECKKNNLNERFIDFIRKNSFKNSRFYL